MWCGDMARVIIIAKARELRTLGRNKKDVLGTNERSHLDPGNLCVQLCVPYLTTYAAAACCAMYLLRLFMAAAPI